MTALVWATLAAVALGQGLGPGTAPAPLPATASSASTTAPLEVQLRPAQGKAFEFGKVAPALFTLRNVSDRAILVTALQPVNNAEETIALSGATFASHDGANIAHEGFLLPGQQVVVEMPYRPLFGVEQFNASYVISAEKFDGGLQSLAPLSPRIQQLGPDGRFHLEPAYGRFDLTVWQAVCRLTKQPVSPPGPYASTRAVLAANLKDLPAQTCLVKSPAEVTGLAEGQSERVLAAAAELAKARPGAQPRLTYSQALGGYVVFIEPKSYLVKASATATAPTGATATSNPSPEELPLLPPLLYKDADSDQRVLMKVGQRQDDDPEARPLWRLWGKLPVVYGDGIRLKGEFVPVQDCLGELVARFRHQAGQVRMVNYYFHGRYYELLLPGGLWPSTQRGTGGQ